MSGTFKPMLAATVDDVAKLTLPLLASVKLDGIRAIVLDGVVVSRSLKPIPNKHVQQLFGGPKLEGLDGELIVGNAANKDVFRNTTSGVMAIHGTPDVWFFAFDHVTNPSVSFAARQLQVKQLSGIAMRVIKVGQTLITDVEELNKFEAKALADGYEGVMLRHAGSPYKHGRGTAKAQDLMKLKRFADAEAKILGVEEQMHNGNEAVTNALGAKERSSKQAGMVGKHTLGALLVQGINGPYAGIKFSVGTGFDDATRHKLWRTRHELSGQVIKYKFFPTGSKDAPRFPVFLGFRSLSDT